MHRLVKLLLSSALALSALGCQAIPTARLVTTPLTAQGQPPQTAAAAQRPKAGLQAISPAMASRILQAEGAQAQLWGLNFETEKHDVRREKYKYVYYADRKGGRKERREKTRERTVDYGWKAQYGYAGESTLSYLTAGRFLYTVPAGKVLVLNTVERPDRVTINGFRLAVAGATRTGDRHAVGYVFGEGETLVFSLNQYCAISGYTADPSIFAGVGLNPGAK